MTRDAKRPAGGGAHGGKKRKFGGGAPPGTIPLTATGFLVSAVTGQEHKACREVVAALRAVYEKLAPCEKPAPAPAAAAAADAAPPAVGAALDADLAALASEDEAVRAATRAGGLRETRLGTGLLFVTPRGAPGDPPPSTVAVALARAIQAGDVDVPRTRNVLRVTPFDVVVPATLDKIVDGLKPLVAAAFPPASPPLSTAVAYDHRSAPGSPDRETLTAAVAGLVPAGHRVDLRNPDRALVVHAVRGVAGLAVVEAYRALAKLNLRELAAPGATAALAAAAEASRKPAAAAGGAAAGVAEGEAKEGGQEKAAAAAEPAAAAKGEAAAEPAAAAKGEAAAEPAAAAKGEAAAEPAAAAKGEAAAEPAAAAKGEEAAEPAAAVEAAG